MATLRPGGRNTAIYTAALKIGSTLSAARSTHGAEEAAAAWSDQAAEDTLMAAVEQNGYIDDHSAAAARSAIRSGLRNGLRSPRPLPDLSGRRAPSISAHPRLRAQLGPGAGGVGQLASTDRHPAPSREPGTANSGLPSASSRNEPALDQGSGSREAEGCDVGDLLPDSGDQKGIGDWREAIVQQERELQSRFPGPGSELTVSAEAIGADIGG